MELKALNDLTKVLNEISEEVSSRLKELEALGEEIASSGIAIVAKPRANNEGVAGVDGSRAKICSIGSISIYIAKAVAIPVKPPSKPIEVAEVFAIDDYVDEYSEGCAEDYMLFLEAKLYGATNAKYVFIDGPLIDPPRPQLRCSKSLVSDLHAFRAKAISSLIRSDRVAIGIVKKLVGSLKGIPATLAYRVVCSSVAKRLGIENANELLLAIPYDRKLAPEEVLEPYRSIPISSFVVCNPRRKSVLRIDVAPSDKCLEALSLLASLPKSDSGEPLPIALAHELSKVPKTLLNILRSRVERYLLELTP